jgi:anti-sigma B factor antagonist
MSVGRTLARRAVVVALPEEIDLTNAAGVAEQLTLAGGRHSVVIIDMSATRFCDCAGARAIVLAHKRTAEGGAELRLVVTAEPVRRIFGLLGVDRLLDLYPSVEAAHGAMLGRAGAVQHLMAVGQVITIRGRPRSRRRRKSGVEGEV